MIYRDSVGFLYIADFYKTNESLASSRAGMLNHSVLANEFSHEKG